MRGGLLMACTLTLEVAFAAYAHSEDQHDIEDDDAAAVRFLEMLEPAQARVAVLPPDSPLIVRIPVKKATHSGNKKPPGGWSNPDTATIAGWLFLNQAEVCPVLSCTASERPSCRTYRC